MFNALLGSFVAWSLTAGALPGPWPVAAALALGGALLLRGLAGAVPAGAHPVAAAGVVFRSVRVNGGGRRTPARLSVAAGRACYIFCC